VSVSETAETVSAIITPAGHSDSEGFRSSRRAPSGYRPLHLREQSGRCSAAPHPARSRRPGISCSSRMRN
jgi:hypothetical protein